MASSYLPPLMVALDSLKLDEGAAPQVVTERRWQFVETLDDVKSMLDQLYSLDTASQALYMDTEGVNLSRHGSISILQIWAPCWNEAFLLDVHTLGSRAFTEKNSDGKDLKQLLETTNIKKYWFDVRNDADALYALFDVRLAGVVDVQLMEVASRVGPRHVLCSLAACIKQEQTLSGAALEQWQATKDKVVSMFDPKRGGSYEVFNMRPLPQILVDYCIGDVRLLPLLQANYQARLSDTWLNKVDHETARRLNDATKANYKHQGKHKIFAPKKWRFVPTKTTNSLARVQDVPSPSPAMAQTTPSEILPNGNKVRRKGRVQSSIGLQRAWGSARDCSEEQNWALCDKDCGWCGHCGDGIL